MNQATGGRDSPIADAPDPTARWRRWGLIATLVLLFGSGPVAEYVDARAGSGIRILGWAVFGATAFTASRRSGNRGRRWRFATWFVALVGMGWLTHAAFKSGVLPRNWLPPIAKEDVTWIPAALAVALWGLLGWFLWRETRGVRAGPARTPQNLGKPHDVDLELVPNGRRTQIRIVIRADAVTFATRDPLSKIGSLEPPLREEIALSDVLAVRPEGSRVVLELTAPQGRETLPLVPASYAERERLLWELAVRRPDLFAR